MSGGAKGLNGNCGPGSLAPLKLKIFFLAPIFLAPIFFVKISLAPGSQIGSLEPREPREPTRPTLTIMAKTERAGKAKLPS